MSKKLLHIMSFAVFSYMALTRSDSMAQSPDRKECYNECEDMKKYCPKRFKLPPAKCEDNYKVCLGICDKRYPK
jgi:hypothetical protein